MKPPRPVILTFDIFGTVVDWKRGMRESVRKFGFDLTDELFENVIDAQEVDETRWSPYREITAHSLVKVLGMKGRDAAAIGVEVGRWPLFEDSAEGLRRLLKIAPCVATTNSDRSHGKDVQRQLGFRLTHWICSEETRCYKPSASMWLSATRKLGLTANRRWWHVSAYADYDLIPAKKLGFTTVFIPRPHSRPGAADVTASSLVELASLLS